MIGPVLVASMLLLGQSAPGADTGNKEKTKPKETAAADTARAVSEYNLLKAKTPMTAAAQWKLATWCEEHGLKDLAYVHFGEVISLDPSREAAWKRLGYKKRGNLWVTDAQIAIEQEQKKADKFWGLHLKKIHKDLHGNNGKAKRDLAQAALDKISDPKAVLSAYRELGGGGVSDQWHLIDILSRIKDPISSKVLALVAVYGKSADVRRRSTDILLTRPSHDFLEAIVDLMSDELKYDVRPVGGPGSPGILFVEGEKYSVNRFYAPPPAPYVAPQPGDVITYDAQGMPVINRIVGSSSMLGEKKGVPGSKILATQRETDVIQYAQISVAQLQAEAARAALSAKAQLEADVEIIKSINKDRKTFNELLMEVAREATGEDAGKTPKEWRETLAGGRGLSKQPSRVKPAYAQLVDLAYTPMFQPVGFIARSISFTHLIEDT